MICQQTQVDGFAFRVTAFDGLLYGLFNLAAWAAPSMRVMGVMHPPLLVMPIAALWLVRSQPQTRLSHA